MLITFATKIIFKKFEKTLAKKLQVLYSRFISVLGLLVVPLPYILMVFTKGEFFMAKFKIDAQKLNRKSINRSIRFSPDMYDKLSDLAKENSISFNKVVSQCIEYALKNQSK